MRNKTVSFVGCRACCHMLDVSLLLLPLFWLPHRISDAIAAQITKRRVALCHRRRCWTKWIFKLFIFFFFFSRFIPFGAEFTCWISHVRFMFIVFRFAFERAQQCRTHSTTARNSHGERRVNNNKKLISLEAIKCQSTGCKHRAVSVGERTINWTIN